MKKSYEQEIDEMGRETAQFWLRAALKGGTPEQVSNQINIIHAAATHLMASLAVNMTKPECVENPKTPSEAILYVREQIENEIDHINNNMQSEFVNNERI